MKHWFICLASLFGMSSLVLSAIARHALDLPADLMSSFQVAAQYQIFHAILLLLIALFLHLGPNFLLLAAGWLCVIGTTLFCGSIYAKIFLEAPDLTFLAPYGGISLMLAWLCLALYGIRRTLVRPLFTNNNQRRFF